MQNNRPAARKHARKRAKMRMQARKMAKNQKAVAHKRESPPKHCRKPAETMPATMACTGRQREKKRSRPGHKKGASQKASNTARAIRKDREMHPARKKPKQSTTRCSRKRARNSPGRARPSCTQLESVQLVAGASTCTQWRSQRSRYAEQSWRYTTAMTGHHEDAHVVANGQR